MGASLWYLSRATGVASIVLLTAVVVLGVLVSGRRRPHGEHATVVMGVHRWLSLGMVAFLVTHVVTAVVDGYVDINALAVLLPFTSAYETFWVGLGTLALDVLVAVLVTSWWRHRGRHSVSRRCAATWANASRITCCRSPGLCCRHCR